MKHKVKSDATFNEPAKPTKPKAGRSSKRAAGLPAVVNTAIALPAASDEAMSMASSHVMTAIAQMAKTIGQQAENRFTLSAEIETKMLHIADALDFKDAGPMEILLHVVDYFIKNVVDSECNVPKKLRLPQEPTSFEQRYSATNIRLKHQCGHYVVYRRGLADCVPAYRPCQACGTKFIEEIHRRIDPHIKSRAGQGAVAQIIRELMDAEWKKQAIRNPNDTGEVAVVRRS